MLLEGIDGYKEDQMKVHFQNENLLAEKNDQVVAMTPDLICLVDYETLLPVTTESLKYGKRVRVIGLPSHEKWRTAKGIETAGPKYFGYDYDFVPIEQLVKKGVAEHV